MNGGAGWMQLVSTIGDISSRNVEANYSDSFSAVSDPASFIFSNVKQRRERKRQEALEERQMRYHERGRELEERKYENELREYLEQKRWRRDFANALFTGRGR